MNSAIKCMLAMATAGSLLLTGCNDTYLGVEQLKTDGDAPGELVVGEVTPHAGALEIKFTLPKGEPDIAQVVASYTNKRGELMEFTASRYSATILVEGFTGTDEVTVALVCVDGSGNRSGETIVSAAPLLSPVEQALTTMTVEPAFGGVKVDWENKSAQPFAIHILTQDTLQKGVASLQEDPSKTIYNSDSANTTAYVRQYPSIEQEFGFVISDKWGNRTDTLIHSLVPYKEVEIDYNKVEAVSFFNPTLYAGSRDYGTYGINPATGIQNDGNSHGANFSPQTMFNGIATGNRFYGYKFVKNLDDPDPANRETVHDFYLTFDLNMDVRLSRVKIFPRTALVYTYTRSSVKRFRIWGTNDANAQRWEKFPETWTLIGEYVGREPANLASLTDEEIEYFNTQQEYAIAEGNVNPEGQPTESFRYMRIQLMESYNANEAFYTINEFQMFGEVLNTY
ncbi:DUF5126 domain-containing protein [Parapedobacter sp. 10938]|uniref:DUF5126 domain-containing protein n=1 Tax=Parapedobacter flavus TaxID=3110225 RepID=UPI002DBF2C56|nr:DUF5126 domain-containing protein [Parapedobacter sp. 10938]MEC3880518.1 DUF5126 domain-containing protein [Parapedobacter sp. 10938]